MFGGITRSGSPCRLVALHSSWVIERVLCVGALPGLGIWLRLTDKGHPPGVPEQTRWIGGQCWGRGGRSLGVGLPRGGLGGGKSWRASWKK